MKYRLHYPGAPMQRIVLQILCLCLISFLIFGPLVTPNIRGTDRQQIKNNNHVILNPDQKIQEILQKINETVVRNFMDYLILDIGPRCTGTAGCEKAATYIFDQFESMGLQARYQNWSAKINKSDPDALTSQNIEGTLKGTNLTDDEVIIFNAHYDTVRGTVGANDDGSGTVSVLAAAAVLSQYTFKKTLKFVTFSGEEQGLFGSDAYVRELYDQQVPVLIEFNADGIGRATTADFARKIRLSVTEDTGWIVNIMKMMTNEYGLNFNITTLWNVNRDLPFGFSDYFPFARFGFESISVWQADGDPHYHSPQDDITNVNISYLTNMTRHIAATMAILADAEVEVPQVSIAYPREGKIIVNDVVRGNTKYVSSLIVGKTTISAEVIQGKYPVDRVEFYYGKKLLFTDVEKPYEYLLNKRSIGFHRVRVVVYDTEGNSATDRINILFFNLLAK